MPVPRNVASNLDSTRKSAIRDAQCNQAISHVRASAQGSTRERCRVAESGNQREN
jgi:hypothetical protein